MVVREAKYLYSVNWAIDGRGFYCGNNLGGPQFETLRVELDGTSRVITSRVIWKEWGMWAKPSPDGKHLALTRLVRDSNVWLFRKK
jgi:hypothetical protein